MPSVRLRSTPGSSRCLGEEYCLCAFCFDSSSADSHRSSSTANPGSSSSLLPSIRSGDSSRTASTEFSRSSSNFFSRTPSIESSRFLSNDSSRFPLDGSRRHHAAAPASSSDPPYGTSFARAGGKTRQNKLEALKKQQQREQGPSAPSLVSICLTEIAHLMPLILTPSSPSFTTIPPLSDSRTSPAAADTPLVDCQPSSSAEDDTPLADCGPPSAAAEDSSLDFCFFASLLPSPIRQTLAAVARRQFLLSDEFLLNGILDDAWRTLDVSHSAVSDTTLEHASVECGQLAAVDVRCCEAVSGAGILSLLRNCSHLHTIRLGGSPESNDAARSALRRMVKELLPSWEQPDRNGSTTQRQNQSSPPRNFGTARVPLVKELVSGTDHLEQPNRDGPEQAASSRERQVASAPQRSGAEVVQREVGGMDRLQRECGSVPAAHAGEGGGSGGHIGEDVSLRSGVDVGGGILGGGREDVVGEVVSGSSWEDIEESGQLPTIASGLKWIVWPEMDQKTRQILQESVPRIRILSSEDTSQPRDALKGKCPPKETDLKKPLDEPFLTGLGLDSLFSFPVFEQGGASRRAHIVTNKSPFSGPQLPAIQSVGRRDVETEGEEGGDHMSVAERFKLAYRERDERLSSKRAKNMRQHLRREAQKKVEMSSWAKARSLASRLEGTH